MDHINTGNLGQTEKHPMLKRFLNISSEELRRILEAAPPLEGRDGASLLVLEKFMVCRAEWLMN